VLTVRCAPRTRVALPAALVSVESSAAFALAHVAAGGAAPEPLWLVAFAALVYGGSSVVLRERAPIRVVLPVLLAAQVLGHAWLTTLAPPGGASHHAVPDGGALLGLTPSMVLAHAAAGLVTGVMWAWRRRVVDVLLQWARPVTLPVAHLARTSSAPARRRAPLRWFLTASPDRGPPSVSRSSLITAPA